MEEAASELANTMGGRAMSISRGACAFTSNDDIRGMSLAVPLSDACVYVSYSGSETRVW
jgi:hypothetical protein